MIAPGLCEIAVLNMSTCATSNTHPCHIQAVSEKNTSPSHQKKTHQNRDGKIEIGDNDEDAFGEKIEVSVGEEEDDGACDLGGPEILDLGVERAYILIEGDNWWALS